MKKLNSFFLHQGMGPSQKIRLKTIPLSQVQTLICIELKNMHTKHRYHKEASQLDKIIN